MQTVSRTSEQIKDCRNALVPFTLQLPGRNRPTCATMPFLQGLAIFSDIGTS